MRERCLMEGRIPMSTKDLNRLETLTKVKEGRTNQKEASKVLGISPSMFEDCLKE